MPDCATVTVHNKYILPPDHHCIAATTWRRSWILSAAEQKHASENVLYFPGRCARKRAYGHTIFAILGLAVFLGPRVD